MSAAGLVATNALCRAQELLPGPAVAKPMFADPGLLWLDDEGRVKTAILCGLHPAAGLLSEASWATHSARHGTAATCSCGAVAGMAADPISVGFDVLRSPDAPPDSGWPCALLDGTGFVWRGPLEVRSIKTCVTCSVPPVIVPAAIEAEPEPVTRRRRIWFGRRPANLNRKARSK